MRIVLAILIGISAAGCDPLPQTDFVNETGATITLRLAESGYWDTAPDEMLRIRPGKRGRFVQSRIRHYQLPIQTAGCEYVFPVPPDALDASMGAVDAVELRNDLRIYKRYAPKKGGRPPRQPPGFPLAFSSKTCGDLKR